MNDAQSRCDCWGRSKLNQGIKIKVLYTRKNGAALDVEIESTVNNRGIGVLKLYGLNTRKQNVVTVKKAKEVIISLLKFLQKK